MIAQVNNFGLLKRTRRLWIFGFAMFFIHSGAQAQNLTQPDSSHVINFQPKPVTAKSFIIPASLIAVGALRMQGEFFLSDPEIKEARDKNFATFHTSVDNYLQYAPIAAGYAMLINNKNHRFLPYTKKVLLTEIIVIATVQSTKRITKKERPDGLPYSFPSGHTAQAFAGAALFCDEFAQHDAWLAATAYSGAAAVGVLRILNNKHWASDVIAGAGFGILSAKISECIIEPYYKRKHSTNKYQF